MPSFVFVNCMVCSWLIACQHPITFSWSYRRLVAFVNSSCKNCIIPHTIAILVYARPFWHCNLVLHVLKQLHQLLYVSRGLGGHVNIFTVRGGYCNEAQKSSIHRTPNCTQNLNDTPETKCKVLNLTLCNYTQPNW